jgi:hypothetical protein
MHAVNESQRIPIGVGNFYDSNRFDRHQVNPDPAIIRLSDGWIAIGDNLNYSVLVCFEIGWTHEIDRMFGSLSGQARKLWKYHFDRLLTSLENCEDLSL